MTTLYLMEQGATVQQRLGQFVITVPHARGQRVDAAEWGDRLEANGPPDGHIPPILVPMDQVDRVLILGRVHCTTPMLESCLQAHIPVIFLSQFGQYKGHLWSAEQRDLRLEAAQFQRFEDGAFQVDMARRLVQGKIDNTRQGLLKWNRERHSGAIAQVIDRLAQLQHQCQGVDPLAAGTSLDQLRGYEGAAAAQYFGVFAEVLTAAGFEFAGRNRRPPKDPVNSLLSFGYTLLFKNVLSLMLTEGMNLYLGNLHRSERQEPHLVSDLMEEWRSPIVDTLVVQLINQRVLHPDHFCPPNHQGGVYLTDAGRRLFLKHFENRMQQSMSHPEVQHPVHYRRAIQLQLQRYRRALMQDIPYVPFRRAV